MEQKLFDGFQKSVRHISQVTHPNFSVEHLGHLRLKFFNALQTYTPRFR